MWRNLGQRWLVKAMPAPHDDDTTAMLFRAVQDLSKQLGTIQADIKEDTAQLLRSYREDTHRSIMAIYTRLVAVEDTINLDRHSRVTRQQMIDAQLHAIHNNQRLWIRGIVFAAILTIGIVIGVWVL